MLYFIHVKENKNPGIKYTQIKHILSKINKKTDKWWDMYSINTYILNSE